MLDSINGDVVVGEVIQPETEKKVNKNISYRGTDFERTPDSDSFDSDEKKNKTGKVIGITASIIAAAALILGAVCYSKGKGADGVEKKFGERMKDGWKELWHKEEGVNKGVNEGVNKAEKDLEAKANDVKNDAEQTIDKAKEEVNGSELKEKINQAQPKTQKAGDPVINEKENIVQTSVADSAEENVVKQETTIEANKPIIEEVKKPIAETVVQKAERSFEDIAKEAKENVAKLTKKIEELEKEVSQLKYGEFPGEKIDDGCYIVKNSEGQVIRKIYAPNKKLCSITYYDPLRPNFETELYMFDNSRQIGTVYQRICDTNEVIHYYTGNHSLIKNIYSLERLNDINDITDTKAILIEKVKFNQGKATVKKYDALGFELEKAEVALV